MTNQHHQALPAAKRRRLIFGAVLRSVLAAAVLVVLYYVLPLDWRWDSSTAIRLLIGILVFAGVMVWEVRAIVGSRYPGLRAVEALALILPLFLLLFASTYFVMERASAASFTQPLTRTDALYFTVTVFSTVGFGDITAKSQAARVVLIVQMLADLALLGAGIRVLVGAVQRGREGGSDTSVNTGPAPRLWPLGAGLHPGTCCTAGFLDRIDGYELNAQLLDLLDEPEQVRLIGHPAGQHRHARKPLQAHAVKQESERIAQLPAKDKPVPAGLHPVAVHVNAASPAGRRPVITRRPDSPRGKPLPGQTRSARPSGRRPVTDNGASRPGRRRRPTRAGGARCVVRWDARYRRSSSWARLSASAREETVSLR